MSKEEIINFIYYLGDKIDPVFVKEVDPRITRFVSKIRKLNW